MGNLLSSDSSRGRDAAGYVISERETMDESNASKDSESEDFHDTIDDSEDQEARAKAKADEMEEFKRQLEIKREQRREILNRHKSEKQDLERSLENERKAKYQAYEANKLLRELLTRNNIDIPEDLQDSREMLDLTETIESMKQGFDELKSNNHRLRRELAETNKALQSAYSDIADLQSQNTYSIKQINGLKEVVSVSKTMIKLREEQLNELKDKLSEIERSLVDREASMLSADLRQEYERQLQNIRTLRTLYEERARLAEVTRAGLVRELEEQKLLTQIETNKCQELTTKVEELEKTVDELQESIANKNSQISSSKSETRGLQAEMSAVNKLFSQVLLGYKSKQDLDKLVHRLEENHGILTHMAEKENGSEASTALPKLLLELVSQVDEGETSKEEKTTDGEKVVTSGRTDGTDTHPGNTSAEEIVQNLPKVWRVLMELLSHQSAVDESPGEKVTTCYKSVETKSGPVLVPSVSQTYIRLKDLIVEKLALIKEVNRMKQLNVHLETRLEEQERKLSLVTTELSKTWHVVGRLRRHHHQLHTHEKILKYELQQKRKLLNELKEELEYCREKWEQAREKNTQSEKDWRKLRAEFSSRKSKVNTPINTSAESGYSDERPSDDSSESNDESEYVAEKLLRSKKKLKKSFETILDSSTDFNLAEREDPASDMIDVADLPLDTQDGEEHNDISNSCNSESCQKSDRLSEETEDEVGDIAQDSCVDDQNVYEPGTSSGIVMKSDEDTNIKTRTHNIENDVSNQVPQIDPAAILKSIKEQNERLARKDDKLKRLERGSAALLKQTQNTTELSEQISDTLDHLINRPSTSLGNFSEISEPPEKVFKKENQKLETNERITSKTVEENKPLNVSDADVEKLTSEAANAIFPNDTENPSDKSLEPSVDFKTILQNIKRQNERLQKKDERLQTLEAGCSEVITNICNTLATGQEINNKLDELHMEHKKTARLSPENKTGCELTEDQPSSRDSSEPSSSTSEMDHEARFAARDLRLKRLEEQTKSLVNKVNKTTSKGVKITYKLEELHNIYGSENSRAGSPSDDHVEESESSENEERDS